MAKTVFKGKVAIPSMDYNIGSVRYYGTCDVDLQIADDKDCFGYDKLLVNGCLNLVAPIDVGSMLRYFIYSDNPMQEIVKHTWLRNIDGL